MTRNRAGQTKLKGNTLASGPPNYWCLKTKKKRVPILICFTPLLLLSIKYFPELSTLFPIQLITLTDNRNLSFIYPLILSTVCHDRYWTPTTVYHFVKNSRLQQTTATAFVYEFTDNILRGFNYQINKHLYLPKTESLLQLRKLTSFQDFAHRIQPLTWIQQLLKGTFQSTRKIDMPSMQLREYPWSLWQICNNSTQEHPQLNGEFFYSGYRSQLTVCKEYLMNW